MTPKNVLVGMSGGPTPVINATLAAIIDAAKKSSQIDHVYGMMGGVAGLANGNICRLDDECSLTIDANLPGAILNTCRHKLVEGDKAKILSAIKQYAIDCILLIGGNDTMLTAEQLNLFLLKQKYPCSVIGVPKTVDNDLRMHHSPGYISAAKYVIKSVGRIIYDHRSFDEGGITIIETMGRNAGWLTAAAYLTDKEFPDARPDFVYLPEVPFSIDNAVVEIKKVYAAKKYCAVVISEGVRGMCGDELGGTSFRDAFGHVQLGGIADILKTAIMANSNIKVRTERLGTLQRACEPDALDLKEVRNIGKNAILAAVKGHSGIMVTKEPTEWEWPSLSDVAGYEKVIPENWLVKDMPELIEYLTTTIYP